MYHLISDPHVAEHVGGREIPPEQAAGVQAILLGQMLTIMIVNFLFFISIKRAYSLLKQEKRDAVTEIRRTTSAP
ncbi:hypothetical protein Ddc_11765 [Ditylenchus destructor]|nr:hypothetical protein Ddc_11765 [Ditylenchus destructor]